MLGSEQHSYKRKSSYKLVHDRSNARRFTRVIVLFNRLNVQRDPSIEFASI